MTMYGKHHSKETKKKMSDANRGRKFSEEHRKKLSDAKKGKKLSEETKKKMSVARKGENNPMYGVKGENNPLYGKHLSEEHRKKLSDAAKGKYTGENNPMYGVKGENHPFYGKHHSEETKKKLSDAAKGENNSMYGMHRLGENNPMYGMHHSEDARKKISYAKTDWDFVREFGTTRRNYPYSMFFDGKHKKMMRELYNNRCVITGMIQEEHIVKYGKKLFVHHWNHDKDSEDPFFMISVTCNINNICPSTSKNKHEWISLFNGIAEDKWCEMLEKGTLEDFYKEFGYDINDCCYIKNI